MRSAFRFALPFGLAAFVALATVVWVRSYWRVDKAWVQVLPQVAVEARVTPGQVTFGSTHSTVRLPLGDSDWFTWPVESYYADYIPPPANTLFCDFRIYNGTVTIPLWCLVLLSTLPSAAGLARRLARAADAARLKRASEKRTAIAAAIPAGSLLRPNHPLIAVGQVTPDAQSTPVLQVVS